MEDMAIVNSGDFQTDLKSDSSWPKQGIKFRRTLMPKALSFALINLEGILAITPRRLLMQFVYKEMTQFAM